MRTVEWVQFNTPGTGGHSRVDEGSTRCAEQGQAGS